MASTLKLGLQSSVKLTRCWDVPLAVRKGHWAFFSARRYTIDLNSTFSQQDIDKAKEWLEKFTYNEIPTNVFDITYSRASGAGGQKVNKTSSKATISLPPERWMNPQFCFWIPGPVRSQIVDKKVRYETKAGGILVQSDLSRNRDVNTEECFRKLLDEIKDKVFFAKDQDEEDVKRWEEIREDRREKRLFNKKRQSDKKKSRSKKFDL